MPFLRKDGVLCADDVGLNEIATQVGTPCYVYAWQEIASRYHALQQALEPVGARIRYAVKANSNLSILNRLARLNAGFDIVSGGELERVIRAGGDPASVVFSGVGKSQQEISFALKAGIACFNVESSAETRRVAEVAKDLGLIAPIAVRVNPDIKVETHPYIATGMRENKFGVAEPDALALATAIKREMPSLRLQGICCHIGSQLSDLEPYAAALDAMLALRGRLAGAGIDCDSVGIGGGFGIRYRDESPLSFDALGQLIAERAVDDVVFEVEPGRSLVGPAGVLLTRVEYLKPATAEGYRNFCVVDAAMNDLSRPALYNAYHRVENVGREEAGAELWNIVGPVCESGDFLALDRELAVNVNDLLAVRDAGAYGFVMSSNYNSRPRPPEILVDGAEWCVVRRRESISEMLDLELS